jgi:hypothetical protein
MGINGPRTPSPPRHTSSIERLLGEQARIREMETDPVHEEDPVREFNDALAVAVDSAMDQYYLESDEKLDKKRRDTI